MTVRSVRPPKIRPPACAAGLRWQPLPATEDPVFSFRRCELEETPISAYPPPPPSVALPPIERLPPPAVRAAPAPVAAAADASRAPGEACSSAPAETWFPARPQQEVDAPEELDESDFEEVWDLAVDVDVSFDEDRAPRPVERSSYVAPRPDGEDPPGEGGRAYIEYAPRPERYDPPAPSSSRDPSSARYVVSAGARPGEITLRALDPGEPPPYGAPIAMIGPSCSVDARAIGALLYGRGAA